MWVRSLGQEDCPGGRYGNPLQYSCLENPIDKGAWWVGYSPELQRVRYDWAHPHTKSNMENKTSLKLLPALKRKAGWSQPQASKLNPFDPVKHQETFIYLWHKKSWPLAWVYTHGITICLLKERDSDLLGSNPVFLQVKELAKEADVPPWAGVRAGTEVKLLDLCCSDFHMRLRCRPHS